ncbi:MAG: hypothetical protein ACD_44C00354G0002 [uncultured bacterium]|nr:MAG: hypothetical protein ACD_44C00354G0002 [uncultured bacterium]
MSKSLFKSTSAVSGMTLISRILGFLRDMIAAQLFGATAAADAFYVAFKIPNFMRSLFAEGAFQQSFVPILSAYHTHQSLTEIKQFTSHVAGCLTSVLIPLCILGTLGAPLVIHLFAYGLNPERFELATNMLSVMFPYVFFVSLTAFMSSVLNTFNKFLAPAFTSSILNICMIFTALYLSPHLLIPIESQSYAVLLAGVLQILFLAPFLHRLHLLSFPRMNWRDPGVKKVLKLLTPSLFGASVGQISMLITTLFASFLPIGSVTWLYYSERLMQFPLGVISVALATVILPHLSKQHASHDKKEFKHAFEWGIRCNLLIGTLAMTTLGLMATPLIATLFKYGKFNITDVLMTERSTIAYALGLPAFMLNKILVNGFFAKQNIKTPVNIGIGIVTLNILFNFMLIAPLAHAGLALSATLGQWINTIILFFILNKHGIYKLESHWIKFLFQLLFANGITACLFVYAAHPIAPWLSWSAGERFTHLFFWLMAGTLSYALSLFIVGVRRKHLRF